MKIQTAILVCIATMLTGCASYSSSYRQDVAYYDAYQDASADRYYDDTYYGDSYYDNSYYDGAYYGSVFDDGFYGGGFYGGGYGSHYGYCSSYYAFCPRDPWAVFLFPIGGGRYWLLFDGYDNRSYYFGNGYGYGWPYDWWGYPYDHHDWDHHHHHHNPPPPNGWVPSPQDGRRFDTPHPRKGIFTPNAMPRPGTGTELGAGDGTQGDGRRFDTPHPRKGVFTPNATPRPGTDTDLGAGDGTQDRWPRERPDEGSGNRPPMRWRPPPSMTTGPVDGTPQVRDRPDPGLRPIRMPPPDQTRVYVPEPVRQPRPMPSEPPAPPTRSTSDLTPPPANVPNRDNDGDRADRIRRRREDSGGG